MDNGKAMTPIILIDGSSYFFRAFHALPSLMTATGQHTGAIYGVINMIKRLIKDYQPQQLAVIFDAKGKTFRDELYPLYKAHRKAMPEELSGQFEALLNILKAMGLPIIIIEGVEADDVIGTLTNLLVAQGHTVIISTGDKDLAQLVNAKVTLINTMTNQILDIAGVINKFGVHPGQMIDYLTLVGDSVDNIPGVPKCGPKTAAKWLQEYQSLNNLINNVDKITGKIGIYLRASLHSLPLSKQLVSIKTDVALPVAISDLTIKPAENQRLIALFKALEFKTWLNELLSAQHDPTAITFNAYEIIYTESQLYEFINKVQTSAAISMHIETTPRILPVTDLLSVNNPSAIDFLDAQVHQTYNLNNESVAGYIVGIAIALQSNTTAYFPLCHQINDIKLKLSPSLILKVLRSILENPKILKIGFNLKNNYNLLKQYDITLAGIAFDIMLESYVLNSNASNHDLSSLALKYLGYRIPTNEDLFGKMGKGVKCGSFYILPIDKAALFTTQLAELYLKLHNILYLAIDHDSKSILQNIEMPLVTVLADMEVNGVLIDSNVLKEHGARLKLQIKALVLKAMQLAGTEFNLNSPKQLQEILFDKLKLPILHKTPTGQPSTAESVLQELALQYELPAIILQYRSLSKLVSTYIDALPKCINPKTGRVHTSYNQAVAATGRLSSSDPNLQNIPIRNEEGRLIRKAFIATPGYILLAADYSQIELRIMAHLSQDEHLLEAFRSGLDIHTATASEIFQIPLDQVTPEQRRRCKAINFGLIYGMSAFGLTKQLAISHQDALYYLESYFKRYPGVFDYMQRTRQLAHQLGYVTTIFGRRLYLPEINSHNLVRQKAAERMAINAPMQGTAADLIKKAMLDVYTWQNQHVTYTKMIMQVHDELVFEVAKDASLSARSAIKNIMEHVAKLDVPLQVSIGVGNNWDEAH